MYWKSAYITLILFLISLQVLNLNIHLVNADFSDQELVSELNITCVFQEFNVTPIRGKPEVFLPAQVPEPTYPYGILTKSLMELVVNAMVCGWVAFLTTCSTLYLVNRRFVWGGKKTISVILLTVIGGVLFNFGSWLYQVRPYVLDAEFVYFGYPFVWLTTSRSTFWGSPEWAYYIQWYGLIGNIVFYMWVIFGVLVGFMILSKMLAKFRKRNKM